MEEIKKCKDCGISLMLDEEIIDGFCSQCQAERDKQNLDIKII